VPRGLGATVHSAKVPGCHGAKCQNATVQKCTVALLALSHCGTVAPSHGGTWAPWHLALYNSTPLNLNALPITDTELNVIAALAQIGLISTPMIG
jgi:hypothetical protein